MSIFVTLLAVPALTLGHSLAPLLLAAAAGQQVPLAGDSEPLRVCFVDGATGDDSHPGTRAQPWKTIQHAATAALPGTEVRIASGVYQERVVVSVSGNAADGMIVFRGDPDGGTILDGSAFTDADYAQWGGAYGLGLIDITDRSWLGLRDLEIRGLSTSSPNWFLMGIQVAKTAGQAGPMERLAFRGLDIHDIRYTGTDDGGGAQGMAVYGGSVDHAITGVTIVDCELHDLRLGQSETMTLNGNVDGFTIAGCRVHDNDNIGISLIGWEGTAGGSLSDDSSDDNADLYGGHHPHDRARNGVVRGNRVWRCSTEMPVKNPTYPANDFSAGGIYIDGGIGILVQRNEVSECDIGISLGCEHGGVDDIGVDRDVRDVLCRNNVVSFCGQTGIELGGYNRFRGTAVGCRILNNTVYKCSSLGWAGGQILVAKSHDNQIANNVLYARGTADTVDYDGYQNTGGDWRYDHGVVLGSSVGPADSFANALDHNLYFAAAGSGEVYWKWQMDDSIDPVQGFSGLNAIDLAGLSSDPQFVNGTNGTTTGAEDFRLSGGTSPAVDSGNGALDVGALDAGRLQRIAGPGVDRGAHEQGSSPPD